MFVYLCIVIIFADIIKHKAMRIINRNRCDMKQKRKKKFSEEYLAVYTDGSGNNLSKERFGGMAYAIINPRTDEIITEHSEGFKGVTNNQMELLAIIKSAEALPDKSACVFYTDSKYCIFVLYHTEGIEFAKNMDYINRFREIVERKKIKYMFTWVKGHNGDKWNEYVDKKANEEYMKMCNC